MKYSRDWPHDVYVILDANNDRVKIGHSAVPKRRLYTLQSACSEPLSLALTITFEDKAEAEAFEQRLHKEFEDFGVRGEWFDFGEYLVDLVQKTYAPTTEQVTASLRRRKVPVPDEPEERYLLWDFFRGLQLEAEAT